MSPKPEVPNQIHSKRSDLPAGMPSEEGGRRSEVNDGYGISKGILGAVPVVGVAVAAREVKRSLERGDKGDAALAGAEALPVVGLAAGFLRSETEESRAFEAKTRENLDATSSGNPGPDNGQKSSPTDARPKSMFAKIDEAILGAPGEKSPLERMQRSDPNSSAKPSISPSTSEANTMSIAPSAPSQPVPPQPGFDEAIKQITSHQSLARTPGFQIDLGQMLTNFVGEPGNDKLLNADPNSILTAFKQTEEFSKMPSDDQAAIKNLAADFKLQADAPNDGKKAGNDNAAEKKNVKSAQAAEVEPTSPDGETKKAALQQQDIDRAAAAQLAANGHHRQHQQPPVTMGAVIAAALTGRLKRVNAEPGASAQAFANGSMADSNPTEVMDQKLEKFKVAGEQFAATTGDLNSVSAKQSLVDYRQSMDEMSKAFGDERRSIMAKVASGEMRSDAASEHLEGRSKAFKNIQDGAENSELGQNNPEFMKNAKEQMQKLQESIKSMMDGIKNGLNSLISAFSKPEKSAGSPAPGKAAMQ